MKNKLLLSGAVAAVAFGALDASAQLNYQNGDMLAAFGKAGSGLPDVIVDLGPISSFQAGATVSSWNLNAVLTSQFGSVDSSIYWSVFGANDQSTTYNPSVTQSDPNTIWTTLARSNPSTQTHAPSTTLNSLGLNIVVNDIGSIGNTSHPNQAGPGLIVDYAPGIELVQKSVGAYSPMMTDPYSGNFQGDWIYNVLNNGTGTSDLYQNNPSSRSTYLGNFTVDGTGLLTFNPVPEPSTWAMFGSGVLALLAIRRRK